MLKYTFLFSCLILFTLIPIVLGAICGNGVVESGEQCDVGSGNGDLDSCCTSTCTRAPVYQSSESSFNYTNLCTTADLVPLIPRTGTFIDISYVSSLAPYASGTSCPSNTFAYTLNTGTFSQGRYTQQPINVNSAYQTAGGYSCVIRWQITYVCGQTVITNPDSISVRCCGDGVIYQNNASTNLLGIGAEVCEPGNDIATGTCCASTCNSLVGYANATVIPTLNVPAAGATYYAKNASLLNTYDTIGGFNKLVYVDSADTGTAYARCTGYSITNPNTANAQITFPQALQNTTCSMGFMLESTCNPTLSSSKALVGTPGRYFWGAYNVTLTGTCGNGVVDNPAEQCDLGTLNGAPGSCCDMLCQSIPWVRTLAGPLILPNCVATSVLASSWAVVSNIDPWYYSTFVLTAESCTGSVTISGTGNATMVNFPAMTTPQTCTVSFRFSTKCGTNEFPPGRDVLRYCCGDSITTVGAEQCDTGGNNGVPGSCCSSTCTALAAMTADTPPLYPLQNCIATVIPVSTWFPNASYAQSYWSSVTLLYENCTGTITANSTSVNFPSFSTGEQCVVGIRVNTSCGTTLTSNMTVVRSCCGDGVVTPNSYEVCDLGTGNNIPTSCCQGGCQGLKPFTATQQIDINTVLCFRNISLPAFQWFAPGLTIASSYWDIQNVSATNCTFPVVYNSTTDNVDFYNDNITQVCYVNLTAVTICGQSLTMTRIYHLICCGDEIVTSPETCDGGSALNGVPGYCCSAGCNYINKQLVAQSPPTGVPPVNNCLVGSLHTLYWFYSPTVIPLYWESINIVSTTCTGNLSIQELGGNPLSPQYHVIFSSLPAGETCSVTLNVTAICGQYGISTIQVTRTCCGNGVIEAGEVCDSTACCNSTCSYQPSTYACRSAAGPCDHVEYCSGNTSFCPPDTYMPNTFVCNTSTNDCTTNVSCTGLSVTCPSNYKSTGTVCRYDNNYCFNDACASGLCIRGAAINYNDGQFCNGLETCNTTTGTMIPGTPPNCSDNNSCTVDACNNGLGVCSNTPIVGTYGQCGSSNLGACQYGNKTCNGTGPTPIVTCVGNIEPTNETCGGSPVDTNCNGLVGDTCPYSCLIDSDCDVVARGQCQDVRCNVDNITCYVIDKPTNTSCNDGLACTANDKCYQGECIGDTLSCNDNNECTLDACTEPSGVCVYDPAPFDGSPCTNEANLCSTGDLCNSQGICVPGIITTCPPSDQCNTRTCDPETGSCVTQHGNNACDDGLSCTINDACNCGTCTGHPKICDDFLTCTTDVCQEPTGDCGHILQDGFCLIQGKCYANGEIHPHDPCQSCDTSTSVNTWTWTELFTVDCDDLNSCTFDDKCNPILQLCAGTPVVCPSSPLACQQYICDPDTAGCVQVPMADGTPCDTGYYCVVGSTCLNGFCQPDTYRDCSIEDSACTTGICDEDLDQCVAYPLNVDTQCDSLAVCDDAQNCISVDHPPCPDSIGCMVWNYDFDLKECTLQDPLLQSCSDNNACSIGDYCNDLYTCVPGNTVLNCNDNILSTVDFCYAELGCIHELLITASCDIDADCPYQPCRTATCLSQSCVYVPMVDGTRCDDGDVCNGIETCLDTVCISQSPLTYSDSNICTVDSCDPIFGVYHTPINGPIDDDDPCTATSSCVDGVLVTTPYVCPSETDCLFYKCMVNVTDNSPLCMAVPYNEGGTCATGLPCTVDNVCARGVCVGDPKVCPQPGECIDAIYCDPNLDACIYNYTSAGSPCNMEDLCNSWTCNGAGSCDLDTPIVTCSAIDQCHDVGVCIPDLGVCTTPILSDNTPCNDGNACTLSDTCQQGTCFGDNHVVCEPLDQCHLIGICDTGTGLCSNPVAPDGSFCEDSNLCSEAESCVAGVCVPCGFIDCNVSNPCLIGHCNATTGCYTTYNDGVPCDDGDECTTGTTCLSGSCPSGTGTLIPCNNPNECGSTMCMYDQGCMFSGANDCTFCLIDSDCPYLPCHMQHCNTTTQQCYFTVDDTQTVGCTDGNFCNGMSQCSNGACYRGPPPNCDDDNSCTYDYCNVTLDVCTHTPLTGNVCFSDDHCVISAFCSSGGACLANTTVDCAPAPACHYALGCDGASGECEYGKLADGTPCDDGNSCTIGDTCTNGLCGSTTYLSCPPTNPCQQNGHCDQQLGGCVYYDYPDGIQCDDGSNEVILALCDSGDCSYTQTPTCTDVVVDIDPCQYVEYTPFGCVINNVTDGTPCTTGLPYGECTTPQDTCVSGTCTRTWQVGLPCRLADSTGCDITDLCVDGLDHCPNDLKEPDGTPCPSTDSCVVTTCLQGNCVSNTTVDCSYLDTNVTNAVCSPVDSGCVTIPPSDGTPCDTGDPITQCVLFDAYVGTVCTRFYQPSTQLCDDGNNCTVLNYCSGYDETCVTSDPDVCAPFDSACTLGVCNQTTGECYAENLSDTTLCNSDDDLCTAGDHCQDGTCVTGDPVICPNSTNPCYEIECQFGDCVFVLVDITCLGDFCDGGCAYPRNYWQHYNTYCRSCEIDRIVHPWPLFEGQAPENFEICGNTYYQWLIESDSKNAFRKLVTQWITAFLNVLNGACIPITAQNAYDASTLLLANCETTISVSQPEAEPYKTLYDILLAYNTGMTGPGTCDQIFCGNSTNTTFNTIACVTSSNSFFHRVQRSAMIHALTFDDREDCGHGVFDLASDRCRCDIAWSGKHCDKCAETDSKGDVFMCVPSISDPSTYVLRSIPSTDVALYLKGVNGRRPSIMPNTMDHDCACEFQDRRLSHRAQLIAKDTEGTQRSFGLNRASVQAWSSNDNTELIARIDQLGQELEDCEATWYVNNTYENATTVVYVNVTNTLPPQNNPWVVGFYSLLLGFVLVFVILLFCCSKKNRKYKR